VTLYARAMRPDIVIIDSARTGASSQSLLRAGRGTRVVNPQRIGGQRIARQPAAHVVEFLDVVMHDGSWSSALEEVRARGLRLAGRTSRGECACETTGAL